MDNRVDPVLKTLLYSDIFDYPLKKEEIWKYLIAQKGVDKKIVYSWLKNLKLKGKIYQRGGYYFLAARNEIVNKRKRKEKESVNKIKLAKKIIKKISFIPSAKFIGISGALSMKNSDRDDDIDIFVISENHLIWTTRFLLILILSLLGVYRRRNAKNIKDKICLNLIIEERNLEFFPHNLFTAHEIFQLIPIIDKDDIYRKFVFSNNWAHNFLPNAYGNKPFLKKNSGSIFIFKFLVKIFMFEKIFKFLQFNYMKEHITKEEIKEGFLGFHPFDYKDFVLKAYTQKLKKFM